MSGKKKRLGRPPKTKKPKGKRSWRYVGDDWENLSYDRRERVGSPTERERRRQVALEGGRAWLGTPEDVYRSSDQATGTEGAVVSVYGSRYLVEIAGESFECHIRDSLKTDETGFVNPVAVGDKVVVVGDGAGGYAIAELLERDSLLTRPASSSSTFKGYLRQIVAANIDQLLIVTSWREPRFWPELVDRYLVTADVHDLEPIICVNKIDLVDDAEEYDEALAPYGALGCDIVATSTTTGQGIEELRERLKGKSSALSGLSGVGKSSLLNALQPGLGLRVGEISAWRGRDQGRHTTTHATLLRTDEATSVVDTPGIREWGLSGLTRPELWHYFPEIEREAAGCRFTDCRHLEEPDCAVRAAAERGDIDGERYYSYGVIYDSLEETIATW